MQKDVAEKNGTLLRSSECIRSRITSGGLLTLEFKHVDAKCYPALLLLRNRSLLMLLRRHFFAFFALLTGALMDTGKEQAKRVIHNGKKETTTSPLCWTAGANTVGIINLLVASSMPRVLATARIHSVILPLLHSWTSLLNIVTLPCCVSRTSSVRSGLLAPVHSSATDDTRGIFLWWFFLLITGISLFLFSQMKQQAASCRTHKKEMVVTRSCAPT
ncbi:unnamed protein product [Victoria cruziana]